MSSSTSTFNLEEALPLLIEAVAKGQQSGAYSLEGASNLSEALSYLKGEKESSTIIKDELQALQFIINAIQLAQSKGAYTLTEAASLFGLLKKIVEFAEEKRKASSSA